MSRCLCGYFSTCAFRSVTERILSILMYAMHYSVFLVHPSHKPINSPFRRRQPVVESPPLEDRPGNLAAIVGSRSRGGVRILRAAQQSTNHASHEAFECRKDRRRSSQKEIVSVSANLELESRYGWTQHQQHQL